MNERYVTHCSSGRSSAVL